MESYRILMRYLASNGVEKNKSCYIEGMSFDDAYQKAKAEVAKVASRKILGGRQIGRSIPVETKEG